MLLENPVSVNYKEEKLKVKLAELQTKLDMKSDGQDFEILGLVYNGSDRKSVYVHVKHNKCGNEFHVTASKFFNKIDAKCPECGSKLTYNELKELVEKDGEYELISTTFKNAKDKVTVKHLECGNEYEITIRSLREGKGKCKCTKPNPIENLKGSNTTKKSTAKKPVPTTIPTSQTQSKQDLKDFLIELLGEDAIQENATVSNSTPTFYIPELSIAIQYSEMIAHSEDGSNGTCNRKFFTNMMYDLHDNAGVRLVVVSEDEFRHKTEIVKLKLKHILGRNSGERIYARKCTVKEIDSRQRRPFLTKYHIQGPDVANTTLGLFYGKELVAVMSFIKPRKAMNGQVDKYDYELSRFAAVTDRHVVGGFGKLLKYFKDNYEWNKVLTYADLRWTSLDNNVYLTNGFKHLHNSDASYGYVDSNSVDPVLEFRFKYRKSELERLFPQYWNGGKTTEKEIMTKAGYYRWWNCGNMVFELEK